MCNLAELFPQIVCYLVELFRQIVNYLVELFHQISWKLWLKFELKIGVNISFRVNFKLFLRVGGWVVGVENEVNANSAFNLVEVEAELGNIISFPVKHPVFQLGNNKREEKILDT